MFKTRSHAIKWKPTILAMPFGQFDAVRMKLEMLNRKVNLIPIVCVLLLLQVTMFDAWVDWLDKPDDSVLWKFSKLVPKMKWFWSSDCRQSAASNCQNLHKKFHLFCIIDAFSMDFFFVKIEFIFSIKVLRFLICMQHISTLLNWFISFWWLCKNSTKCQNTIRRQIATLKCQFDKSDRMALSYTI